MRITVTKIKDNQFNGNHPNYGSEMPTRTGYTRRAPEVGSPLLISTGVRSMFSTSTITEVRETEFDTLNSTYSYKILPE